MLVFYPEDGVSNIQKKQMVTQEGNNLEVCAIKGNFDDAQTGVKQIFTDKALAEKLAEHNIVFSSRPGSRRTTGPRAWEDGSTWRRP